ncbi:hypothetical protein G4B88_010286 [Cannabis sativa]|uniref:Uncharacterized protein n=1 Tax=Cannabis sativa TaxID=3483 RepID=A0A7J6I5G8_CANSA|nr:hypothetical protein G4B88_010286 [Cannabis sativa]
MEDILIQLKKEMAAPHNWMLVQPPEVWFVMPCQSCLDIQGNSPKSFSCHLFLHYYYSKIYCLVHVHLQSEGKKITWFTIAFWPNDDDARTHGSVDDIFHADLIS